MGDWDIMCMGCYNNDGFTPPGYTAYEKVFMGWIDYVNAQPGTYYTLPVFNLSQQSTDKAVRITSDLNENEYFVLEYRKRQGWDRYLPGQGIMITHITYNPDRWWGNSVNNQDIQLMTIVPVDNTLSYYNENSDLWPRDGKNQFTDNSTPAAKLYMRANGSITGNAGYLGKPVTEMVINNNGTASFWFMKDAVVDPVISVSTDDLNFGNVMMTQSGTMTMRVYGQALTGDITLTLNDANGVFSVNPTVISNADAANGTDVIMTFTPDDNRDFQATLTLSSDGAQDVIVNLAGHGLLEGYTPVMQPADSVMINLTQFRADWTDQTPDDNVASYTLEVYTKPLVVQLETADFSNVPDAVEGNSLVDISGNYSDYMPAGWSATSYLGAYGNALILAYDGTISSPTYNLNGYEKMTVVIKAASYYYDNSTISVSNSMASQEVALGPDMTDYVIVLDCAANDAVTIQSLIDYSSIKQVTVYAGDLTTMNLNAQETGDTTYRLITDITDKFYLVKDLEAGGTFNYKVKAVYSDGTESPWSNIEEVTLFENGHSYQLGDVNHDGTVNVTDVTTLITYQIGGNVECCQICGDINNDGNINVTDVTMLITMMLTSTE